MKSFFVVAAALLATAFACTDLKDNIVKIANVGSGLNVEFADVLAATYDSNHNPACAGSGPSVRLPGIVRLVSGQITVKKAMSLEKNSDVLATLQKDSFLIGKVCVNGKSKNFMVPDSDCHINLCAEAGHLGHADLCKLFETPGVHTLGDLQGDLKGFNGTVAIPAVTGMIKDVIKGTWKTEFTLVSNGETLAHVKAPSNEEWIDVE
uniref:Lipoprotein n=1 Tax=Steinernema glaseri TaxID=37863 RepID=A0A1I7YZN1_9BILA